MSEALVLAAPAFVLLMPPHGAGAGQYIVYVFLLLVLALMFLALLWMGLSRPFLELSGSGIRYRVAVPRLHGLVSWSEIREISIVVAEHDRVRRVTLSTVALGPRARTSTTIPMRNIPVTGPRLLDELSQSGPESLRVTLLHTEEK